MPLIIMIEAQMGPQGSDTLRAPLQDWVRWVVGMFVGPTVDIYAQELIRWMLVGILSIAIKGMVPVKN